MTDRIVLWAFAKVNYALEVRGLRDDGYHEISSVFQSVSLADELEIERSGGGFELIFEPDGVEVGPLEENTVYKAWALLWALGPLTFLGAALRLRTLYQTVERVGRRLNLRMEAVTLSDPLAAVDVDKLADHGLVEELLQERA